MPTWLWVLGARPGGVNWCQGGGADDRRIGQRRQVRQPRFERPVLTQRVTRGRRRVRLREGVQLDDALRRRISTALRTELSPRHIPDGIIAVPVVPHNRTGKKLELPVKKILLGAAPDEVASRDVLADPTALDAFVALRGVR